MGKRPLLNLYYSALFVFIPFSSVLCVLSLGGYFMISGVGGWVGIMTMKYSSIPSYNISDFSFAHFMFLELFALLENLMFFLAAGFGRLDT